MTRRPRPGVSRPVPVLPGGGEPPAAPRIPRPSWVVLTVAAVGLLLSLVGWRHALREDRDRRRAELDALAAEARIAVSARVRLLQQTLHATSAFFASSADVSAAEWRSFVLGVDLRKAEPAVAGLGFLLRAGGDREFRVAHVDGELPSALERGGRAGTPIADALARACREGTVALTPRMPMSEQEPGDTVVLLLLPAYRRGHRAAAADVCPDSVFGVAAIAAHLSRLTRPPRGVPASALRITLREAAAVPAADLPAQREDTLNLGGQAWILRSATAPELPRRHPREPAVLLLGGLLMTLLGSALAGSEAHRRELAQRAARSAGRELARAESALDDTAAHSRELEGRLASIVGSAMDAIIHLGPTGHIQLLNPAAEAMLRCRAEEVVGQSLLRFVPRPMQERHRPAFLEFRHSGARHLSLGVTEPLTMQRFDGEEFPIEATISRSGGAAGQTLTMILRDVSAQRNGRAAREALEAQLRQAQKLEAIGTMAGGIAHDFNNILGSILGNADLAEQDLAPDHPAQPSVTEIRKAGERARDLVQRMLGFTGQQEQARRPVELSGAVRDMTELVRATLPSQLRLELTLQPGLPVVLADVGQIQQALTNLCSNSIQALGDRPGTIHVRLARLPAGADPGLPEGLRALDCLELVVADDGPGMSPEVLRRVFDPFFTTRPVGQGSGLGLSVVHGIVARHDGRVTVESAPERGTLVRILLPACREAGEDTGPSATLPRGGGARVLLVDDEESLLTLGARTLRRLGYEPVLAQSPLTALELASDPASDIDLVVTDQTMPGMSGVQLAERLVKRRPHLPILLMTGYAVAMAPEEIRGAGIRAVLAKPVSLPVLAAALAGARTAGAGNGQDSAGG